VRKYTPYFALNEWGKLMAKDKKKAFTLTELLVVVVVIGILAAVALPKYSRIMETRKTTEAEEMMAAVRTEQEHRCALDKPYVADFGKLSQTSLTSLSSTKAQSEHFVYELSGTGMLASSKGKYTYNLEMPSYTDGRVCCSGDDCDKLNKDYMNCNTLKGQSDYRVENDCAAQDVDSTPVHKPCDGQPKPDSKTKDCNQEEGADWCGLVTTSYECVGDTWVPSNSGVCKKRKEDETKECPCGPTLTAKYECSKETYEWELGEFSPAECLVAPAPKEEPCPEGEGQKIPLVSCDEATNTWKVEWDESACEEVGDPKTCAGWDKYFVKEGSSGKEMCHNNYRVTNFAGYTNNDVTEGNFSTKCCKESEYRLEKGLVVEVDHRGKHESDQHIGSNEVLYYATSGLNTGAGRFADIRSEKTDCLSGDGNELNCFVTSDCSWGDDCFTDTEPISEPEFIGRLPEVDDAFCFGCNAEVGGDCPDVAYSYSKHSFTYEGYAYAGGDPNSSSDPCDNFDGKGDLGPMVYHDTCTDIPVDPSNTAVSNIKGNPRCGTVMQNGGSLGCSSSRNWMDQIQTVQVTFERRRGCGNSQQVTGTCSSTLILYYRPRITTWDRYYCVRRDRTGRY